MLSTLCLTNFLREHSLQNLVYRMRHLAGTAFDVQPRSKRVDEAQAQARFYVRRRLYQCRHPQQVSR